MDSHDRFIIEELNQNIMGLVYELRRFNDLREAELKDRVVSVSEAARITGRTRQTISRKIREGYLKKVTRGGVTGILLSELQ